ncbi:alpha/beta-hydrolase N-terminal domain-containing protein, partial [Tianweitania sp.]|uniref:alpha/beta-hydrolase N-terminal domain-containing protein n=1 Tax=Tianweitania sp. TaxID=2021634 RepID=UPI0028A073E5
MKDLFLSFPRSFSVPALCLGTVFFAASLTPSLLPRDFLVQGLLSGVAFSVGYAIAMLLKWLGLYLGLHKGVHRRHAFRVKIVITMIAVAVGAVFLWQASAWQNSVRLLMGLEPVASVRPFAVGGIALVVALVLTTLGWLFRIAFFTIAQRLKRHLPRRLSYLIALVLAFWLFWFLGNGLLASAVFRVMDASYQQFDALIEDSVGHPTDPLKTGSSASLLEWDHLGRTGRQAIAAGPNKADIEAFTGASALEPLRVYVGVESAETIEDRAQLALEELKRIGG